MSHLFTSNVLKSSHIIRLAWLLTKAADSELNSKCNLTYSQLTVLILVSKFPEASQKLIAEKLNLTAAAVSRLSETLFRKNYINRQPHPTNRRVNILNLTSQGEEKLKQGFALLFAAEQSLYQHLDEEELSQLLLTLDKLIHILDAEYSPEC